MLGFIFGLDSPNQFKVLRFALTPIALVEGRLDVEDESLLPYCEPQRTKTLWRTYRAKAGGPRNFFLVHDSVADTQVYLNLARSMPGDLCVFGITPLSIGVPLAPGQSTVRAIGVWAKGCG